MSDDSSQILQTLTNIAKAIRSLGLNPHMQSVLLGVSEPAAVDLLASVKATPKTSHYFDGDRHEVIVLRTLMIKGVEFRAQSDRRPATPEERDAYQKAREKEARIAALRAEIDALQGGAL